MRFSFTIHHTIEDPEVLFAYAGAGDKPGTTLESEYSKPAKLQATPNCASIEDVLGSLSPAESVPSFQPAPASLSRKQKQRQKFRKSERGREARRQRRAGDSKGCLGERVQKETTKIVTSLDALKLPKNSTGFCGSSAVAHSKIVDRLKTDEPYFDVVLQSLQPIALDFSARAPTEFRDSNGILFGLRPFPHRLMTREFMIRLMRHVDTLVMGVGAELPKKPHTRGKFAQILLGYKHGMGNAENFPYLTSWLSENAEAIQAFRTTPEMRLIISFVSELLHQYFPAVASLYSRVNDFWVEKSKAGARMEFGLFFNLAVNLDLGGVQVRSIPHRDVMNIAFGVCVIMPFGFFPHGLSAWLVNLEAGIVIQLPPMVPYFLLSSLITHYNVDRHEFWWDGTHRLELVTTEHWEKPTEFNTAPLSAIGSGRGSLVFYNQGTVFHWMLTGHQYMEEAAQAFGSRENLAAAMMVHAKEALGIQ